MYLPVFYTESQAHGINTALSFSESSDMNFHVISLLSLNLTSALFITYFLDKVHKTKT